MNSSLKVDFVSKVLALALSDKVGYVQVCSKIANFEFFEKVFLEHSQSNDSENSEPIFRERCRRHDWMEGDVGYTYFERCKECSNSMNHRVYVIFKNKFPEFKFPDLDDEEKYPNINHNIVKKTECYAVPGTLQKRISEEELEDFYIKMEDIYPFPEEFI
jgi:hypothetical protein